MLFTLAPAPIGALDLIGTLDPIGAPDPFGSTSGLFPDFDNDSPSRARVTRDGFNQRPDGLLLGCCV